MAPSLHPLSHHIPFIGGHRGNGETDRDSLPATDKQHKTPENTLASIKEALRANARFIEIDVMLTGDAPPQAVVTHSNLLADHLQPDSSSLLDPTRPFVSQYCYSELRQFKLGKYQDAASSVTEPMPLLEDVLRLMSQYPDVMLNIELKGTQGTDDPNPQGLVETVAATVHAAAFPQTQLIISSFAASLLQQSKKLLPQAKRAMLFTSPADSNYGQPVFSNFSADYYEAFTPERIQHLHNELDLSYVHPEITTVNAETIRAVAGLKSPEGGKPGLTCWSLYEPYPIERQAHIQEIISLCQQHGLQAGFITNYIGQMRALAKTPASGISVIKP